MSKVMLLGVDFESYYDTQFSLSRMPTVLYVRDERFKAYGASIKVNDEKAVWVKAKHLPRLFADIPWGDVYLYGHNLNFDGFILSDRYGVRPRRYIDTLGMSRGLIGSKIRNHSLGNVGEHLGLGGKLGGGKALVNMRGVRDPSPEQMASLVAYAVEDIELTYRILQTLMPKYPAKELAFMDMIIRMQTTPLLALDHELLATEYEKELQRIQDALAAANVTRKELSSNDKFAELLRSYGVEPPLKRGKPTKKDPEGKRMVYAFAKTDQDFDWLMNNHHDPHVVALIEARLGTKSTARESRTKVLRDIAATGSLPVPLNVSGAQQTHRLSGADGLNLQNLQRGSAVRRAITVPEGYALVAADQSQIELRVGGTLAGEMGLVEPLRAGRCTYSEFGTRTFGTTVSKSVRPDLRQVAKVGVLSGIYGTSAPTFNQMLWQQTGGKVLLPESEALHIITSFRKEYPALPQLWGGLNKRIEMWAQGICPPGIPGASFLDFGMHEITGPRGLSLKYPNLHFHRDEATGQKGYRYEATGKQTFDGHARLWGSKLLENICQFVARETMADVMQIVNRRYPVVLQVHDELVCVVRMDLLEEAAQFIHTVMSTPPKWWPELPVACEVKVGQRYGDLEVWHPK